MIKASLISKRVLDDKDFVDRLWNQFNTGSLSHYQISADADGNLTGYTHITTNTDVNGNGNSHTSTNQYDANWNLTESAYSDSSGNNSVTQYQTSTDADGNVALEGGSDSVAIIIDIGNSANGVDGKNFISDLATVTDADVVLCNDLTRLINEDENLDLQIKIGAVTLIDLPVVCDGGLLTQYQTSTDADGNVTSHAYITTNTDANGNSYIFTNYYDANWNLTESAYSDSSGNNSVTQYQTSIDAEGTVTNYTHITTNTDANGNSYTSTNHYDANWNLTESAYSDSSGNNSVTQYQTSIDAEGTVTSYTHHHHQH